MAKRRDIVRYTAEEVAGLHARGEDRTDWARVNAKTEAELAVDTASDPAWEGIDEEWARSAKVVNGLLARPKENKRQVTIRFDADVLEFFKTSGRGWQGRMNAVLRRFMERQH
jgi:uncharacterized protein (DUF4415 family)